MVLVQPCRTTAAYEAIPEKDLALDLTATEARLHEHGWETLANAGVMLVVRRGADDATIFRSGKLLVKTREAAVARRVWDHLSALYQRSNHGR